MMIGIQELLALIGFMTKNEVRAFRQYASQYVRGSKNTYLELFEKFEHEVKDKRMDINNKAMVKALGKKAGSTYQRNKNYLMNMILESLHNSDENVDAYIAKDIHLAKILIRKGQHEFSAKLLEKAEANASVYDKTLYQLQILNLKANMVSESDASKIRKFAIKNYNEEKNLITTYLNTIEYSRLSLGATEFSANPFLSAEEKKEIQCRIKDSFLISSKTAISLEAKILYNITVGMYHYKLRSYAHCLKAAHSIIELLEAIPEMRNEYSADYVTALDWVLLSNAALIKLNEYSEALDKFEKIASTLTDPKDILFKADMLVRIYRSKLFQFKRYGKSDGIDDLVTNTQKFLDEYGYFFPFDYENWIRYSCSVVYFINNEFGKALRINNELLYRYNRLWRNEVKTTISIFDLILHYVMGHNDYIESKLISNRRRYAGSSQFFDVETIVLEYMEVLIKENYSQKAEQELFIKMKEELLGLYDKENENQFLLHFDIVSWLDSEIQKRPMIEVIREKGMQLVKSGAPPEY